VVLGTVILVPDVPPGLRTRLRILGEAYSRVGYRLSMEGIREYVVCPGFPYRDPQTGAE
jgi:hypothetical protein